MSGRSRFASFRWLCAQRWSTVFSCWTTMKHDACGLLTLHDGRAAELPGMPPLLRNMPARLTEKKDESNIAVSVRAGGAAVARRTRRGATQHRLRDLSGKARSRDVWQASGDAHQRRNRNGSAWNVHQLQTGHKRHRCNQCRDLKARRCCSKTQRRQKVENRRCRKCIATSC